MVDEGDSGAVMIVLRGERILFPGNIDQYFKCG